MDRVGHGKALYIAVILGLAETARLFFLKYSVNIHEKGEHDTTPRVAAAYHHRDLSKFCWDATCNLGLQPFEPDRREASELRASDFCTGSQPSN